MGCVAPWAVMLLLAGCLDGKEDADGLGAGLDHASSVVAIAPTTLMAFEERIVTAAVDLMGDTLEPTGMLFEPNIEVSDRGVLYITGHTALVNTHGAPVYMSHDDGVTWSQLPFAGPVGLPSPVPGATPPPSDEIFLVAGDDGWLYGVDITLATYPVNAWSGDGALHAYHNPDAYDNDQVALQQDRCQAIPLKDRPWAAYANGTLLMVSNPGAGPAQIGVLPVPPSAPAGVGATVGAGAWNLCAGPGQAQGDCRIPGVPGLRLDGLFAVPQACGPEDRVHLILGNARNVMDTRLVELFPFALNGEYSSKFPHAGFDAAGVLYVAATNNTGEGDGIVGGFNVAVSADGGETFEERTFTVGGPVRNFWMDPNRWGPGMLVVWTVDGETGFDWHVGHLHATAAGVPFIENVALAVDEGPFPHFDLVGSALGPDGRAYISAYEYGPLGGTPLAVFVQVDGPTMATPGFVGTGVD